MVREFFGWRGIRNRRELASLAGLTPTPYDSGESRRKQGIIHWRTISFRCFGIANRHALRFEAFYDSLVAESFGNLRSSPAYLSVAFLKAEPSSMNFRC